MAAFAASSRMGDQRLMISLVQNVSLLERVGSDHPVPRAFSRRLALPGQRRLAPTTPLQAQHRRGQHRIGAERGEWISARPTAPPFASVLISSMEPAAPEAVMAMPSPRKQAAESLAALMAFPSAPATTPATPVELDAQRAPASPSAGAEPNPSSAEVAGAHHGNAATGQGAAPPPHPQPQPQPQPQPPANPAAAEQPRSRTSGRVRRPNKPKEPPGADGAPQWAPAAQPKEKKGAKRLTDLGAPPPKRPRVGPPSAGAMSEIERLQAAHLADLQKLGLADVSAPAEEEEEEVSGGEEGEAPPERAGPSSVKPREWSAKEFERLKKLVAKHGAGNWAKTAKNNNV